MIRMIEDNFDLLLLAVAFNVPDIKSNFLFFSINLTRTPLLFVLRFQNYDIFREHHNFDKVIKVFLANEKINNNIHDK